MFLVLLICIYLLELLLPILLLCFIHNKSYFKETYV